MYQLYFGQFIVIYVLGIIQLCTDNYLEDLDIRIQD